MMSLLPFLHHVKAATDIVMKMIERSRHVCLVSQCEMRFVHVVCRGWPPIATSLYTELYA